VDIKFADEIWGTKGHGTTPGAGFLAPLIFNPLVDNKSNGTVQTQSVSPGTVAPCLSTAMTVTWN